LPRHNAPIDFQSLFPPATKTVKALVTINAIVWFVGVVIIEQYFLPDFFTMNFGLVAAKVMHGFFWQPFTYFFVHPTSPLFFILNMLMLWWMGSSLEAMFGKKFFLLFYFVSGVGAGILSTLAVILFSHFTGNATILLMPVLGASAAILGLFMAYGIYFGDQTVLFMFFFPMKARVMVAILGGLEVVLVLNNGSLQGKVASLTNIGGLISAYVFLKVWPRIGGGKGRKSDKPKKPKSSKLRLVVNNNNEFDENEKPKYWN
jgi:membrane associated rhomboid family serine protease